MLQSEHMFLLLSNFSGLRLHEQAPSDSSDSEREEEEAEARRQDGGTSRGRQGKVL